MKSLLPVTAAIAVLASGATVPARAQAKGPLEVGAAAPDFSLVSATRSGVGSRVSLKELRGKTVVIAFFYKARSGG